MLHDLGRIPRYVAQIGNPKIKKEKFLPDFFCLRWQIILIKWWCRLPYPPSNSVSIKQNDDIQQTNPSLLIPKWTLPGNCRILWVWFMRNSFVFCRSTYTVSCEERHWENFYNLCLYNLICNLGIGNQFHSFSPFLCWASSLLSSPSGGLYKVEGSSLV